MKTKYVCHGLFLNFHNNRTMWLTILHVKFCRWGEKEKEPLIFAFSPSSLHKHQYFGVTMNLTRVIKICLSWPN